VSRLKQRHLRGAYFKNEENLLNSPGTQKIQGQVYARMRTHIQR